mmetsp:Transcript_20023/g.50484  ORF Transcript_20023/g.50484 Transcript_20023/m.50484 type:complete len:1597 (+) Transcript_20023:118-4908(+)
MASPTILANSMWTDLHLSAVQPQKSTAPLSSSYPRTGGSTSSSSRHSAAIATLTATGARNGGTGGVVVGRSSSQKQMHNNTHPNSGAYIDKAGASSWDDFLYERTLVCLNMEITSIAISPCKTFFVVGNGSGDVKVYEFASYAETHTLKTNTSFPPKRLTFSIAGDGGGAAAGGSSTSPPEFLIVLSGDGIRLFKVDDDFSFVKWIPPPFTKMLDSSGMGEEETAGAGKVSRSGSKAGAGAMGAAHALAGTMGRGPQQQPAASTFVAAGVHGAADQGPNGGNRPGSSSSSAAVVIAGRRHILHQTRPNSKDGDQVDLSERSRWQCVAFHPKRADSIVACADMALVVYDTRDWGGAKSTPKILRSVMSWGAPTCCAFTPSGARVVVGHASGSISIWNAQTFAMEKMLSGHHGAITAFEFYTDMITEEIEIGSESETDASSHHTQSESENGANSRSPSKTRRRNHTNGTLSDQGSRPGSKNGGNTNTAGGGASSSSSSTTNIVAGGATANTGPGSQHSGARTRLVRRKRVVLVSTSRDRSLRLWADLSDEDASSWQLLTKIALEDGVHSPKLTSDSLWCLCVSPRLLIWKVATLRQRVFRPTDAGCCNNKSPDRQTASSRLHASPSKGSALVTRVNTSIHGGRSYLTRGDSSSVDLAQPGGTATSASTTGVKKWKETYEHNIVFEPFQRLKATGMDMAQVAAFSPDGNRVIVGSNDGVLGVFVRKKQLLVEYAKEHDCESYQVKRQLLRVVQTLVERDLAADTGPSTTTTKAASTTSATTGKKVLPGGRLRADDLYSSISSGGGDPGLAVPAANASPSKAGQDAEQQARDFVLSKPEFKGAHNLMLTASSCIQLVDDIHTELIKKEEERRLEAERRKAALDGREERKGEEEDDALGERLKNAEDLSGLQSGSPRTLFRKVVVQGDKELPDFILEREFATQCRFVAQKMRGLGLPFLRNLIKEAGWSVDELSSAGVPAGPLSTAAHGPQYVWHPGGSTRVVPANANRMHDTLSSCARLSSTTNNIFNQTYRVLPSSSADPLHGVPQALREELEGVELFRDFFVKALLLYEHGELKELSRVRVTANGELVVGDADDEAGNYYYATKFSKNMRAIGGDLCSGVLPSGVPLVASVATVSSLSPLKKETGLHGQPGRSASFASSFGAGGGPGLTISADAEETSAGRAGDENAMNDGRVAPVDPLERLMQRVAFSSAKKKAGNFYGTTPTGGSSKGAAAFVGGDDDDDGPSNDLASTGSGKRISLGGGGLTTATSTTLSMLGGGGPITSTVRTGPGGQAAAASLRDLQAASTRKLGGTRPSLSMRKNAAPSTPTGAGGMMQLQSSMRDALDMLEAEATSTPRKKHAGAAAATNNNLELQFVTPQKQIIPPRPGTGDRGAYLAPAAGAAAGPTPNSTGGSSLKRYQQLGAALVQNTTAAVAAATPAPAPAYQHEYQEMADSRPVSLVRALELRSRSASKVFSGSSTPAAGALTTSTTTSYTPQPLRRTGSKESDAMSTATEQSTAISSTSGRCSMSQLPRSRSTSGFSTFSTGSFAASSVAANNSTFFGASGGAAHNTGSTRTMGQVTATASRTKLIAVSDHAPF